MMGYLNHVLCFLTTQPTLQVQNVSQWSSCMCTLLGWVWCAKSTSWNRARWVKWIMRFMSINRKSMRRLKWIMRRVNYQSVSHMIWIEMKALQWLVTSVDALWFSFAHLKQSMTWANRRYHVKNDDGFSDSRFVFSHHTNHTASAKHVTMALMYLHAIRLSLVR